MASQGSYQTGSGLRIEALLKRYGDTRVAKAAGAGLYKEGAGILSQSQPLCPVDTGALRGSGYVTPPKREGDLITVTIGYGGPAAKINPKTGESAGVYALMVHENLEAHHPVGQAKYLEVPFNAARQGMTTRVAADMRAELSGRGQGWQAPPEGEASVIELSPTGLVPPGRR